MPKIIKGLTNTQVEKAKYCEGAKNELPDGNGLFLQLYPTGRKAWRFRYNRPVTKARTKTNIGDYPAVSIAQAREYREKYRALLAQGIDPQTHKAEQEEIARLSAVNTFSAVAEQWRAKKSGEVEPETIAKYWQQISKHLIPVIGNHPINEIIPPLITVTLKPLEQIGMTDTVHRLLIYLNDILNYAVNGGIIPFNPCLKVNGVFQKHVKKHNPFIRAELLPKFMADMEKARIHTQTKTVIHFKILTLTRSKEIAYAEWAEIDFVNRTWIIKKERMKARRDHIIPLCSQAIAILERIKPITGNSRYIFPNRHTFSRPMSPQTINSAIKRNGYKDILTAHGLRTTASTYLNEQGYDKDAIELSLAHKIPGGNVRQTYLRSDFITQRTAIIQAWGDYVEQCANVNTL